jgi:GTP cyclohydrolase I
MNKTDSELGKEINKILIKAGVETPMQINPLVGYGKGAQVAGISSKFADIMTIMGLDLTDDSLIDTPSRVGKMFVGEIFKGLDYSNFPKCTIVDNKFNYDEMLLERNIIVNSTCEHHFLPIVGFAHVAYIPNKKVLGLSKLNRIVDFFCKRPQIQERLSCQIFETLRHILDTDNIAVCIEAEHMCVRTRGVEDACSDTITSKLGGDYKTKSEVRAEFYSLIALKQKT